MLSPRVFLWKWRDLTWRRKGPKFNLHHLREISVAFKMAVLTPKSGIQIKVLFHDPTY